ncbi:MAG: hypothetical protein IPK68_09305 [Bdellovibrionales bacterium]|nr:hypothetical protein [Bdellovibrionales bacterium]
MDLIFLESVKKMPLMNLPVRSTFVPLKAGSILISPGSCLDLHQLKKIKEVTDLVAPNLFHCAGVPKASSVFPSAKKWAPVGGKISKPEITWSDELSSVHWPYQEDLPMIQLKGNSKINEVAFFHKGSKSLIVADLCFNLIDAKGIGSWIILNLFGTYRRLAMSKFFAQFIDDKAAFNESLTELFSFDFENIIVGHGENLFGNGKDKLLKALKERDFAPK